MPSPTPAAADHRTLDAGPRRAPWPREALAGLASTSAMVPATLALGFIAYAPAGERVGQLGLTASVVALVIGGLVMALASRAPMPAAAPSAATGLIFAGFIARLLADPAIDLQRPADRAALVALGGAATVGCGVVLAVMGLLKLGSLVRYVPQPVLAGFMNGVAVLILLSQLPALLGLPAGRGLGASALAAAQAAPLVVGVGTAAFVWALGRRFPRAPAGLLALCAGTLAAEALQVSGWAVLPRVGALQWQWPGVDTLGPLFDAARPLLERHAGALLQAALLMALIGALESVLSVRAMDQALGARSDADRELLALAAANVVSGAFGGLPLVYLRLRAMATVTAGGRGRRAMVVGSVVLGLVFALALPWVARLPSAVLAGIVVMLAWALSDRWTRQLLKHWWSGARDPGLRTSLLIVAAVCGVTVVWGFAVGVGLGVVLSVGVFLRAMNRSLIRDRYTAASCPSRRVYPPAQEALLAAQRARIEVLELEGALFFGNADRLAEAAEAWAPGTAFLVLDLRRVSAIDASGAVGLAQLADRLAPRGVQLALAGVTAGNRHGMALLAHGSFRAEAVWPDADHAIEAAELRLLRDAGLALHGLTLPLADCAVFEGLTVAQLELLRAHLAERPLAAGAVLFRAGDRGDSLYLVVEGSISVVDSAQRLVSLSPGLPLGELALLDGGARSADSVADATSRVYELSARSMQALQALDPVLTATIYRNLARHLAERLRVASGAWHRAQT